MPKDMPNIDQLLAAAAPDQRAALQKLREAIQAAAPEAKESVSYGLPAFRLNGKPLMAFGAAARHCALYPMSVAAIAAHRAALKDFETSKGAIRFQPSRPLPTSLVKNLVKARLVELGAAGAAGKNPRAGGKRECDDRAAASNTDPAVDAYMRGLRHPLKSDMEAVRRVILGVSSEIREGIKWNAPSFRTQEWFATFNLRCKDSVQLVFHLGAKVKDNSTQGRRIADPAGLIRWLAKERFMVTVGAGKEIQAHRAALAAIVRAWIRRL